MVVADAMVNAAQSAAEMQLKRLRQLIYRLTLVRILTIRKTESSFVLICTHSST